MTTYTRSFVEIQGVEQLMRDLDESGGDTRIAIEMFEPEDSKEMFQATISIEQFADLAQNGKSTGWTKVANREVHRHPAE